MNCCPQSPVLVNWKYFEMAELNLQLTRKQQEILLRGLRYVRSSVALDPMEFSEAVDQKRRSQYAEIAAVESMLNTAKIIEPATV